MLNAPYYQGHFSHYACSVTLTRVRGGHYTRLVLRYYHGYHRTHGYTVYIRK